MVLSVDESIHQLLYVCSLYGPEPTFWPVIVVLMDFVILIVTKKIFTIKDLGQPYWSIHVELSSKWGVVLFPAVMNDWMVQFLWDVCLKIKNATLFTIILCCSVHHTHTHTHIYDIYIYIHTHARTTHTSYTHYAHIHMTQTRMHTHTRAHCVFVTNPQRKSKTKPFISPVLNTTRTRFVRIRIIMKNFNRRSSHSHRGSKRHTSVTS